MLRNIVRIDEDKCDGCGLCVTACAEGAIQIVDGKARLVKDQYCDGLGACLGECPRDAITIEQRDTEAFDEQAVERHLASIGRPGLGQHGGAGQAHEQTPKPAPQPQPKPAGGGCPGAAAMMLGGGCPGSTARALGGNGAGATGAMPGAATPEAAPGESRPSTLRNWPVQLKLVSPMAPYLSGARLCIAADCTAFAYADFHKDMLAGKVCLIGCPKLDDVGYYLEKLTAIMQHNEIESVDVVYMEVPCCGGLVRAVRQAIADSGRDIPLTLTKVGLEGGIVEKVSTQQAGL